jgi:hypothetical protein
VAEGTLGLRGGGRKRKGLHEAGACETFDEEEEEE